MKVPRDQGLFFAVFFSIGLAIILTMWLILPVYHKESEETAEGEAADMKMLASPDELIQKAEKVMIRAEAVLSQLGKAKKDEKRSAPLRFPAGMEKSK